MFCLIVSLEAVLVRFGICRSNWSNAEFDVVRTTDPSYAFMEQSWVRQAQWGLGDALQLLADHPLAAVINASWTETIPTVPNITGLKYLTAAELQSNPVFPVTCALIMRIFCACVWFPMTLRAYGLRQAGRFQVGFDPASGALSNLLDTMTGTQWASFGNGSLGLLSYRTYSQENFTDFMIDYNYVWLAFFEDDLDDYDKVGIDAAGAVYRELNGTLQVRGPMRNVGVHVCSSQPNACLWMQGLYYGVNNDSSTGTAVFHAVITFPDEVVALAGAPPVTYITTTISLAKNATEVNLAVRVFNKTATRLPEAMFLRFNPLFVAAAPPPLMEKLGEWMDPLGVCRVD